VDFESGDGLAFRAVSDRELVAALRAGDRLAAGQVYDVYGTRLYAYCHELLADPKLSADALRDTFIVAANRIDELAEADEFGAWLYALARAECVRVGISDDAPADAASAARGDRLARLALDVYSMLEPDERELVDLAFRHRLVDADLALVIGEDESAVSVRVTKAQSDLETALLVVLAARTGDPRCEEAAEFGRRFEEIDGKGIPAWLSGASKHVEQCAICGDVIRNRRPLRLFEELPHAFMPPGVRSRVLEAMRDPAGAAFAEQIAARAGKFNEAGFPTGGGRRGASSFKRWILPSASLVAAGCVVALVLTMTSHNPSANTAATSTSTTSESVVTTSPTGAGTGTFNELTASGSGTPSSSPSASSSTGTSVAETTTMGGGQQTTTVGLPPTGTTARTSTSAPPVHHSSSPPPSHPSSPPTSSKPSSPPPTKSTPPPTTGAPTDTSSPS
jgi:DNA-directed RNA polymerase specialized sigma24 family protein